MKVIAWSALSALLGISLCVIPECNAASVAAQKKPPYTWAEVAKWPDFSTGIWNRGVANSSDLIARDVGVGASRVPLNVKPVEAGATPPAGFGSGAGASGFGLRGCMGAVFCKVTDLPITKEFLDSLDEKLHNAVASTCEPMGIFGDSGSKFYFGKDVIVIGGLSDYYNVWRRVYIDGRKHPENVEPSYFGHSIGHWEGDTLVIDTVGISADAHLGQGLKVANYDSHVIERIRLTAPDTLEIKHTIINPQVFTRPVEYTTSGKRDTEYEFPESYCWQDPHEGDSTPAEISKQADKFSR